jgi:hypothetical protein
VNGGEVYLIIRSYRSIDLKGKPRPAGIFQGLQGRIEASSHLSKEIMDFSTRPVEAHRNPLDPRGDHLLHDLGANTGTTGRNYGSQSLLFCICGYFKDVIPQQGIPSGNNQNRTGKGSDLVNDAQDLFLLQLLGVGFGLGLRPTVKAS